MHSSSRSWLLGLSSTVVALLLASPALPAAANALDDGHTTHLLFMASAHENREHTEVTYPLHKGTSNGKDVWYVITDTSDRGLSALLGVNYAPKLANAKGTAAVQTVAVDGFVGVVDFPASVDFSPKHVIVPGPTGFPPAQAQPGAVGETVNGTQYSPLIQLPDGVIVNAPHVANVTGRADKVIRLDADDMQVTYVETTGFYDGTRVHYASFESSSPVAAAIEDVTYAPSLNAAPAPGDESDSTSAREGLLAFTNGQTSGPNLQGINAALLTGLPPSKAPLNILHEVPEPTVTGVDYSPLWEPRFANWTQAAIDAHLNTRQRDFDTVLGLVQQGLITGFPAGTPFGADGFIVTCPVVSREVPRQ